MIQEILENPRFKNLIKINNFIVIPNGERPSGSVWYDKKGNITNNEKEVVTKKPHMMWYDKDGQPTSNPLNRIPKKDKPSIVPLTRDAETKEDFEFIYQRELKLFGADDGAVFKKWLSKKVNDLLNYEQTLPAIESVYSSQAQVICTRFLEWMDTKEIKVKKISNPVMALFCYCIDDAGIIKKRESENLETYCKNVCEKYNLKYATRVSKGFYSCENEDNLLRIKEQILPHLDKETKEKLSQYLEKKQSLKKEKNEIFR